MDQSKKPALPLVVEWRTWLLDSERLTWRGTYVGLALSRWMGRDGTRAWPSQETLAAAMKVSRSTVRRGLQELVDGGWLVPELRPGRTTNYHAARPGMVPEEVLPSESASPPAEGYVPETPKVVKDQEEPNWFKDPGLIDRVLEERQGLKQWLLRGEGFQLAENPAVFREVFREKFPDLPEELIEEFRVRAVNQGRVPSGNARSVTSTDGGLREPATPSALAYTAEMNDEEVKAMLRELYPGGGAAILLLSPQQAREQLEDIRARQAERA